MLIIAALAKRIPMATKKAARIRGDKVLSVIMAFFKSLHLHSPRLATNDRFSLMRCGARMRCGTRPRCRRKSVEDCQHGGTGTLSGVESLRRGNFRLVSQDDSVEMRRRLPRSPLLPCTTLCRSPGVHSNCAHRLACAYRGGEV